jgi:hypothetical protein
MRNKSLIFAIVIVVLGIFPSPHVAPAGASLYAEPILQVIATGRWFGNHVTVELEAINLTVYDSDGLKEAEKRDLQLLAGGGHRGFRGKRKYGSFKGSKWKGDYRGHKGSKQTGNYRKREKIGNFKGQENEQQSEDSSKKSKAVKWKGGKVDRKGIDKTQRQKVPKDRPQVEK